ncbi:MAG: DUF2075 domain-containing protein [Armatimonadota bacterium]
MTIVGQLTSATANAGFDQTRNTQIQAWEHEIEILKTALQDLANAIPTSDCHILLEFPIPRRGKRVDAVLLVQDLIFLIECKTDAESVDHSALYQVEDYALDMRDFHAPSRNVPIVPIVLGTAGISLPACGSGNHTDTVQPVTVCNPPQLSEGIMRWYQTLHDDARPCIEPRAWNYGAYRPVPTIIEAATRLFQGHEVRDIAQSHAGENLSKTVDALKQAVEYARSARQKVACFVTGVPGSGKTLAGLDLAHCSALSDDSSPGATFLSGNGPLVAVLTEALARDHAERTARPKRSALREVKTFLDNVHKFLGEYAERPDQVPVEHVIIFDEAQRAWDEAKALAKFGRTASEPEMMLRIMDRHTDWAVLVGLVGSGQEIHDGEAGLQEWGRALSAEFTNWEVWATDRVIGEAPQQATMLFQTLPEHLNVRAKPALHLNVPIRSHRAEQLTRWVDAVLAGNPTAAADSVPDMSDYPIMLTRSLQKAKQWLRQRGRGLRRFGLLASSGGRRLRSHGIEVSSGFTGGYAYENWFLNDRDDIRSSYQLEVAATEFECQGLELDYTCVCWANDFHRDSKKPKWCYRRLHGTQLQTVRKKRTQEYILNKYRVLLTRARHGMVIWVPAGTTEDPTFLPQPLDTTHAYLIESGATPLELQD